VKGKRTNTAVPTAMILLFFLLYWHHVVRG
jgi:hypothetical protein